jgi:hypothetical protein
MTKRIIKDQTVTTSGVDSKGVTISRDAVIAMHRQIREPVLLRQDHDSTKPPGGRATNFRTRELPDGHIELLADVEIWDDQLEIDPTGMSPSFTDCDENKLEKGSYDIALFADPTVIPFDVLEKSVESWPGDLRITPVKLYRRGVIENLDIILDIATWEIAKGLFNATGADLYFRCKETLLSLATRVRDKTGKAVEFRCELTYNGANHDIRVLVLLSRADIVGLSNHPLDIDQVLKFINTTVGESRISEVLVRYKAKKPHFTIGHIVDRDGKVIKL